MQVVVAHNRSHLDALVRQEMERNGPRCSLNHIDVSRITDFSWLFADTDFDGDISDWNMGHAINVTAMFRQSYFTGDVSRWDVGRVVHAGFLFSYCPFNGDVSSWNTSSLVHANDLFSHSGFSGDVSSWNVASVRTMNAMFANSEFSGHVGGWNVAKVQDMSRMFEGLHYDQSLSAWQPEQLKYANVMVSGESLAKMQEPCFYHWYAAMYQHGALRQEWQTYLDNVLPIAKTLAATPVGVAMLVHHAWSRRGKDGSTMFDAHEDSPLFL